MKSLRIATLLVPLTLVMAACGGKSGQQGDGAVVATVGGRPVTLSYYEDRLEKMDRKYLPDTLDLAGKREFLEFIVNKEVMALKAEELGYGEDPQIKSNLELLENSLVHRTAVAKVTEGKVTVTEDEIRDFYERKQHERLVEHILLETEPEAREVYEKLRAGADFDSLVRAVSTVPREDQHGEPLPHAQRAVFGWVQYGKTQPWVEDALFNTPIGEFTEPVQTNYGWHIFLIKSSRPKRQTPLNDQRALIEKQIRMRKQRKLVEAYYEDILKEHGFKLYTDALEVVRKKLPEDIDPQEYDPKTEVKPVIPFTIAERNMALFEVDGKRYTIGDFSDKYDETSFFERPKQWSGALGLRYWIRDYWLKPLQMERARKDGIDKLPEVVDEVKFRREQMMVSALHANLIANQVPEPTEEQIQEFFDSHRDVYVDKERRICNIIFHPRERVVRRAYEQIKNGDDFIETALRYSDTAVEPKDVQTAAFTKDDPTFKEIAEVAFSLKEKEYSEPFKVKSGSGDGWIVLQVQDIIKERPYELSEIRPSVVNDVKNQWSEDRLNELLEEWKQGIDIVVNEDVLARAEVRRDDVFVPGREETAAAAHGTDA